tara:strand:- start:114 stop:662 length:549 start_codon:yes stop_codon:yes gene_type:complete
MLFRKNKFVIFYIFNIILLLIILFLTIPASRFLSKLNLEREDNEYVSNQKIVNPKAKSSGVIDREIQIEFLAEVNNSLEWKFKALDEKINLKIGENKIIRYEGKNLSTTTTTATAIFDVSPEGVSPYIIKTECFCFIEQTLEPGESKIFSMVFFLDPSLDSDNNLKDLKDLVFTYSFSEYKS